MSVLRVLTLRFASQQAACAAALGVALFAGGCASQQTGSKEAGSAHMSQQPPVEDRGAAGREAPPDDAREPWSPNYGWQPRTRDLAPSYVPIPVERATGITRYATMDPDAVIRHAVAAHEMRRQ